MLEAALEAAHAKCAALEEANRAMRIRDAKNATVNAADWTHEIPEVEDHVYSPPARGLLIHCECPVAGAGAGVECCWKPGGRPKMLKQKLTPANSETTTGILPTSQWAKLSCHSNTTTLSTATG